METYNQYWTIKFTFKISMKVEKLLRNHASEKELHFEIEIELQYYLERTIVK